MVFNDSTVRIRSRLRSALGRLRPSKSSLGLATFMKSELSGLQTIPSRPLPALNLSANLSKGFVESKVFEDLWDPTSTTTNKRLEGGLSTKFVKPDVESCGFNSLPVLNQMLEQQGLLNSPISIHLTSLLGDPSESQRSSRATPRLRTPTDSVYSVNLLCSPCAGPFTPELVPNPAGNVTPECISLDTPSLTFEDCHFNTKTCDRKTFLIAPSNSPSLPPFKLSASPARCCLKRQGLVPHNQPITSQLLQSILSMNESPTTMDLNRASQNQDENSSSATKSTSFRSIELENSLPGGDPMDRIALAEDDQEQCLHFSPVKSIPLILPLNIKRRRSAPVTSRSSVSSFMTNVTGHRSFE